MNISLTAMSAVIVTLQVAPDMVVQPTPQPPNVCPALGVAVRATEEPDGNAAEHVVPQFMPVGALAITPFAPPITFTERLCVPPPCGQPRLAGPSTVTAAELLTIKLEPSLKVAKMLATPQLVFGLTT